MSRLEPIHPKDMSEEQLAYYRTIRKRPTFKGEPDERPLGGPFLAYQRSVPYGELKNAMSRYLRHDGLLPARLVELATIVVCRLWSADYAYCSHERGALREGVSEAVVSDIRNGRTPVFDKADEEAVYHFVYQITDRKDVEDAVYQAAVEELGEPALVELIGLCGHYVTACMALNAFRIPARDGDELLPSLNR